MTRGKQALSALLFMGLAFSSTVSSAQAFGFQIINLFGSGGGSQGGGNSGGAPSPEVNALLGLALAGGTVAYLKRRKAKSKSL